MHKLLEGGKRCCVWVRREIKGWSHAWPPWLMEEASSPLPSSFSFLHSSSPLPPYPFLCNLQHTAKHFGFFSHLCILSYCTPHSLSLSILFLFFLHLVGSICMFFQKSQWAVRNNWASLAESIKENWNHLWCCISAKWSNSQTNLHSKVVTVIHDIAFKIKKKLKIASHDPYQGLYF